MLDHDRARDYMTIFLGVGDRWRGFVPLDIPVKGNTLTFGASTLSRNEDGTWNLDGTSYRLAHTDESTYTCRSCDRSARWTDGQSKAAGDPVDEFWCQTCGEEQPLPAPDAPTAVR